MRYVFVACAAALVTLVGCATTTPAVPGGDVVTLDSGKDESAAGWFRDGARRAHAQGAGSGRARNVILFLGDGMSLTTVAAARILEGQRRGETGEENALSFEQLPHSAFAKTYNTDAQTPDSAGTMTAIVTGAKTRKGSISVGPSAVRGDCAASLAEPLTTLVELAESAGLATGVVTTTRITHATPAATFAHVPERNWENDSDLPAAAVAAGCTDIARQLVEFDVGDGLDVVLGGGRREFLPAGAVDPEFDGHTGRRLDGRDLVVEWRRRHADGRYLWNASQLAALDLVATTRLLGLFDADHLQYEHERASDRGGEPSLAELTRAAITVLSRNPKGYVLVIEAGRIDHAHHDGNAYRALDETIALSDAVRAALAATSAQDTLLLVTADHSHTLTFAGYPTRGNPILGKVDGASGEDSPPGVAIDGLGLPYSTLAYANGPGYPGATHQQPAGSKRYLLTPSGNEPATGRPDLRDVDTTHPDYLQEVAVPLVDETHGGDDVGVWARGPGASAVRGTLEQNVLFHLMLQATPALRTEACRLGACEGGLPMRLPDRARLRRAGR